MEIVLAVHPPSNMFTPSKRRRCTASEMRAVRNYGTQHRLAWLRALQSPDAGAILGDLPEREQLRLRR